MAQPNMPINEHELVHLMTCSIRERPALVSILNKTVILPVWQKWMTELVVAQEIPIGTITTLPPQSIVLRINLQKRLSEEIKYYASSSWNSFSHILKLRHKTQPRGSVWNTSSVLKNITFMNSNFIIKKCELYDLQKHLIGFTIKTQNVKHGS